MGTFGASATLVYGQWLEQDCYKFKGIKASQLRGECSSKEEDDWTAEWLDYWELEDWYKANLQDQFPLVELDVYYEGFLFFCSGLKIHSYVDIGGKTAKPIGDFIAKKTSISEDKKADFTRQLRILLSRFVPGTAPKCDWLLEASLFGPG
jgi:hypothetical protein